MASDWDSRPDHGLAESRRKTINVEEEEREEGRELQGTWPFQRGQSRDLVPHGSARGAGSAGRGPPRRIRWSSPANFNSGP